MLAQILTWLDGRKAIIVSVALLVTSYLVTVHAITPDLGSLISSILTLLGTGAHAATQDMLGSNKLGIRK